MPFIILLVGLLLPRAVIFLMWLFTDWFRNVFDHWALLVLGFIFLPYTTLWYSAVTHWFGGVWGTWQTLIMVVAVIADLGSHFRNKF